jgi:hypothetical protein
MRRILLIVGFLLVAARSEAQNGNILLFFEVDGQQTFCWNADVPCGCRIRMGVWALLQGQSAGGITGVEYRIEIGPNILPDPGWVFSETFNPGLTVLGTGALNPGDTNPRGVTAAWSSCQTGTNGMILIETVDILNMGCSAAELPLRVARADPASNPIFQCPLFVLCDAPVYTKVCLGSNITTCMNPQPPFPMNAMCSTSGEAFLNRVWPPSGPNECSVASNDCPIAAQPESWSGVKALYRD